MSQSLYKKMSGMARKEEVMKFIKAGNFRPGSKPGFYHALKLSYNTIDTDQLSVTDKEQTLTYRYRFSSIPTTRSSSATNDNLQNENGAVVNNNKPSLGYFTALMDELSTNVCYSVGLPSAPGLSLQMETELLSFNNNNNLHVSPQKQDVYSLSPYPGSTRHNIITNGDENANDGDVDIINHVTKLGKTISFTKTEFVHAKTAKVLAISSHVKYMPIGNFLMDFLFSNRWAMTLYHQYFVIPAAPPPTYAEKPMDQVMGDAIEFHHPHDDIRSESTRADENDHVDVDNDNDNDSTVSSNSSDTISSNKLMTVATFRPTFEHTNPFSSMHGGCHALLMEMVGCRYVELLWKEYNDKKKKNCLNDDENVEIILQSIRIDFLSASTPNRELKVQCEAITSPSSSESALEVVSSSSSNNNNNEIETNLFWTVRVWIKLLNGRISSEGKLRFAVVVPKDEGDDKISLLQSTFFPTQ